jgi:methenyltetrahydrofolate cyclohydrolase
VGRGVTIVKDQTVGDYLQVLASTAAVPGGGSAAALAAAMGAALLSMVAKLSAKKAKVVEDRAVLEGLVPELDQIAARLLALSQDDVDAYRAVIDARKAGAQGDALARAYERAADVPLSAAAAAARGLALVPEVSKRAWEMTASDLAVGSELLETGFAGALGNVAINLPELQGEAAARIERAYLELRTLKAQ